MHDMHCHLAFMENGEDVAADAQVAGSMLFANTVTPDEWRAANERFASYDNVVVGFGMHPWWIGDAWNAQTALRKLELAQPALIGEVGLDLGKRHADTRNQQMEAFEAIASWAAGRDKLLLSVHSVHAAAEALDILERTGALATCRVVFHWFTGPSDQLKRAVSAGCYFSAGPRMMATGKGREYVKAIPASQLLLETDAPPKQGQRYSYAELLTELHIAAEAIAAIKGDGALETIGRTSLQLLTCTTHNSPNRAKRASF